MAKQSASESAEKASQNISENDYKDMLTTELDRKGLGGAFVWGIFFFCVTPNILNGFHVSSYTLLGHLPDDQWCEVTDLSQTNWTLAQKRNITENELAGKGCEVWSWDYTQLSSMSYEGALNFTKTHAKPKVTSCQTYGNYAYLAPETTFVADWDLVCDKALQRTSAQVAVSVGKFLGSFSFGIFSDKFGRRTAFILGATTYILSSFICSFSPWYMFFLVGRFGLGAASAGLFYPALAIIIENICLKYRTWMSICFSGSYPIGLILLAIASTYVEPWRYLQLTLTIPSLLLILNIFLMFESPRWLISEKRYDQAYNILFKRKTHFEVVMISKDKLLEDNKTVNAPTTVSFWARIKQGPLKEFIGLFASWKLRRLIFTSYFMFFVTSLSYYVTALNASNMAVSRSLYVAVTGMVDLPSLLVPLVLLRFAGRRITTMSLFIFSGVALMLVLVVPKEHTTWIVGLAMLGRFGITATYAVVTLYTAELYPTEVRNSALGTCSTCAHVGSISAPYVVDVLGVLGWYIPTTICGVCVLVAGLLTLTLPETGTDKLADHVDEVPTTTTKETDLKT